MQAEPDRGYITVGITTVGLTTQAATATNARAMEKLSEALKFHNITQKNVQTVQYSVDQNYKEVEHPTIPNRTKTVADGFKVSNVVRVTICELKEFGKVLDSVSPIATQIHSISFGVEDAEKLLDEARAKATADADRRAKMLTKLLGVELGNIVSISESRQNQNMYQESAYARSGASIAGADTVVSGGSLTFAVNVNVIWRLGKSTRDGKVELDVHRLNPPLKQ